MGAAALALGVAAAFSAGFALAAGADAAGAALALLAGVCAWTADANEIIPATADNQKALLRRITTLNLCAEENRHRRLLSPAARLERRMEPQAPAGIFLCASLPAKSDFHTSSRGCASRGAAPPARAARLQFGHTIQDGQRHRPAGPPFAAKSRPGAGPLNRSGNAVSLRETRAERYGWKTGSDRRSNAAMGRINWALAPASDGGLIPSNERPAACRRE